MGGTGGIGIIMLAVTALAMALSGLPAWIVLLSISILFTVGGVLGGIFSLPLFFSLPSRILGLLEHDLLQALPLYVLIGVMLTHLPLAQVLFRVASHIFRRSKAAPFLANLMLGALLAPMNGSVGSSVAMLARCMGPVEGKPEPTAALICAAGTIGVIVPPSLVLILFGDAMMRAHTEAQTGGSSTIRIINTQDIFHGALLPAGLVLVLFFVYTWLRARSPEPGAASSAPAQAAHPVHLAAPGRQEQIQAAVCVMGILGLLVAVAMGYLYAVEAAASGGLALMLYGLFSRQLNRKVLDRIVHDTMSLGGALFALLVAATMYTLVLRAFETDLWLTAFLQHFGGTGSTALLLVLALLCLCAFVLDAFEIIIVVIPLVMPPLLMLTPDPVWVGVLVLLVLQASFMMPPFGYAVLMITGVMPQPLQQRALARNLLPYLLLQVLVIALVFFLPQLVWHSHAATLG